MSHRDPSGRTPQELLDETKHHLETLAEDGDDGPRFCGGAFLRATALEVINAFPGLGQEAKLTEAWWELVTEVVNRHHLERTMIINGLSIDEFRPRTFFGSLPEEEEWEVLQRGIEGRDGKKTEVKRRRFGYEGDEKRNGRFRLSILLAVSSGYRRTFRSLACLCYAVESLREFAVEFHFCDNFSDDNTVNEVTRFARTLASSRSIPVTLYSMEKREILGELGRDGEWWKTKILNLLLGEIQQDKDRDPDDHFLHIADDDIFIPPDEEGGVIPAGIADLQQKRELKLISAAYSCDDDSGFSAVSSARKNRRSLEAKEGARLLNVYGGCMTTTVKRLREVLGVPDGPLCIPFATQVGAIPFGEDAYLTMKANREVILATHANGTSFRDNQQQLEAYANPARCVGHAEPTNVIQYVRRYLRDLEWEDAALDQILDELRKECRADGINGDQFKDHVRKLRRDSFGQDGSLLGVDGKDPRSELAVEWLKQIRNRIKQWKTGNEPAWLGKDRQLEVVNWSRHRTRHQICKDVVEDAAVREELVAAIRLGPFGGSLIGTFRTFAADPMERLGDLCQALVSLDRGAIEHLLRANRYLFHLYGIAEEALANSARFLRSAGVRPEVLAREFLLLSDDRIGALEAKSRFDFGRILEQAFPDIFKTPPAVLPDPGTAASTSAATVYRCRCPKKRGPRSYTAFLSRAGGPIATGLPDELFLRYCTVIGRSRFSTDSPRRTVFLHMLGEELIRRIQMLAEKTDSPNDRPADADEIRPIEIVRTHYPTLRLAVIHYASPEHLPPFDRIMQSLYVQGSVGISKPLAAVLPGDRQSQVLSRSLARFLGNLHGATLGVRAFLEGRYMQRKACPDNDFWQRNAPGPAANEARQEVVSLLLDHLDQVRLFRPQVYEQWLRSGGDRPGTIPSVLSRIEAKEGKVGLEVAKLVRQDDLALPQVWENLCRNSVLFHDRLGAIGYQGVHTANLYLKLSSLEEWALHGRTLYAAGGPVEIEQLHLAHHSTVGIVDPAVEIGVTLAEILSARLYGVVVARGGLKDTDANGYVRLTDRSLSDIHRVFRETYRQAFERHLTSAGREALARAGFDSDRFVRVLMDRASNMAALSLLAGWHDGREYDMIPDARRSLVHICVDLLHAGTTSTLHFRDLPPP